MLRAQTFMFLTIALAELSKRHIAYGQPGKQKRPQTTADLVADNRELVGGTT